MQTLILIIGLGVAATFLFLSGFYTARVALRPVLWRWGLLLALGIPAVLAVKSVTVVPAGSVKVATLFGRPLTTVYERGFRVVNPFADLHTMNVRRTSFDFRGENTVRSISKDRVELEVDLAFPLRLNPTYAWKVFETIGPGQYFLRQFDSAARSSVRDVVSQYDWKAAATTQRTELAAVAHETFENYLLRDLEGLGFTEEQARATFTILPVQLRRVLPPAKVLNAISEKVAAQEDLERQKTLTQIAEETALRRAKEGLGVKKLFEELPEGFKPAEISTVLFALAEKRRADALGKAVENDQVKVMVLEGNVNPAVALPN